MIDTWHCTSLVTSRRTGRGVRRRCGCLRRCIARPSRRRKQVSMRAKKAGRQRMKTIAARGATMTQCRCQSRARSCQEERSAMHSKPWRQPLVACTQLDGWGVLTGRRAVHLSRADAPSLMPELRGHLATAAQPSRTMVPALQAINYPHKACCSPKLGVYPYPAATVYSRQQCRPQLIVLGCVVPSRLLTISMAVTARQQPTLTHDAHRLASTSTCLLACEPLPGLITRNRRTASHCCASHGAGWP